MNLQNFTFQPKYLPSPIFFLKFNNIYMLKKETVQKPAFSFILVHRGNVLVSKKICFLRQR